MNVLNEHVTREVQMYSSKKNSDLNTFMHGSRV